MAEKIRMPLRKGVAKVPVIMQLEALEYGAACLCMILAYYNKWIPLERVGEDCGVSRDGSNARSVLILIRRSGCGDPHPDFPVYFFNFSLPFSEKYDNIKESAEQ